LVDEEIDLVLETMATHTGTFVAPNLSSGEHNVQIQAKIDIATEAEAGIAEAKAAIGKGILWLRAGRFVNGDFNLQ